MLILTIHYYNYYYYYYCLHYRWPMKPTTATSTTPSPAWPATTRTRTCSCTRKMRRWPGDSSSREKTPKSDPKSDLPIRPKSNLSSSTFLCPFLCLFSLFVVPLVHCYCNLECLPIFVIHINVVSLLASKFIVFVI